jgi:hypothetical protein
MFHPLSNVPHGIIGGVSGMLAVALSERMAASFNWSRARRNLWPMLLAGALTILGELCWQGLRAVPY